MDFPDKDFLSISSSHHFLDDDELEYMALMQDQIQPFFPRFFDALAKQSPYEREQGRCAVVHFIPDTQSQITTLENSADLQSYLVEASTRAASANAEYPRRRLFILEDLPCNYILALGSRLRIPPSFFAGHWDDPASNTFNHRNPFCRSSRSHFRVRYATSSRFELDIAQHSSTDAYAFNTNVRRYIHFYKPNSLLYDEPRSHHAISYWSSPVREDGSWDAVLLVDPPLGDMVRCIPSGKLVRVRRTLSNEDSMPKHFLNPQLETMDELPEHSWQWTSSHTIPKYTCMFDDTLQMFRSRSECGTNSLIDPVSATDISRKLVTSILVAYLRRRYLNLIGIHKNQIRPNMTFRHNYLYSFSEGSLSRWHDEFFDFIVGTCAAMKEFTREMEENMISLGIPIVPPMASPPASRIIPQWELDVWASIRDLTQQVSGLTNSFATGYLQYISIQEARVSNGNAHSLSRITVLTMLFIPLSTVAGIFSMGDDFLPGNSKAWVFWVVSIPVLGILAYLYWHQQIVAMWRLRKARVLPLCGVGKKT